MNLMRQQGSRIRPQVVKLQILRTYAEMDAMVATMVESWVSFQIAREMLSHCTTLETMLVKMVRQIAFSEEPYSTVDTVRPAFRLVKTKPGAHLVSSMLLSWFAEMSA